MDKALEKLLTDIGCPPELIAVVDGKRVTDVQMLANCGTNTTDIVEAILGGTDLANDLPSKSLVRSAWEKASALKQRTLKRQMDGLTDDPEESVMDAAAQDELMTKFREYYRIRSVPSAKIVSDQLLTSWKREFEKNRVTPFPMNRAKTQAEGIMKLPAKKSKLGDKIAIMIDDESLLAESVKEQFDLIPSTQTWSWSVSRGQWRDVSKSSSPRPHPR